IYFSKPLSFLLCLIQKIAVTSFLPAQSFVSDYLCFLLTKQDEPIPSIGHWLYVCFLLRELFLPFSLLFSLPFSLLFSLPSFPLFLLFSPLSPLSPLFQELLLFRPPYNPTRCEEIRPPLIFSLRQWCLWESMRFPYNRNQAWYHCSFFYRVLRFRLCLLR